MPHTCEHKKREQYFIEDEGIPSKYIYILVSSLPMNNILDVEIYIALLFVFEGFEHRTQNSPK